MALRTPLYDAHRGLGATFTAFAGYDMPVHYGSIKDEHFAVRRTAGLFDVSHMSNLWIAGPHAAATISSVCTFDAAGLGVGRAKYTVVLRDDGTILDDTIVFRTAPERYLMVPNAGRNEAVASHLRNHGRADVQDVSRDTAILAVQGPQAAAAFAAVGGGEAPKPFRVVAAEVAGVPLLASGTGYTGEKGVELQLPAAKAEVVWDLLLDAVRDVGGGPVGLGARDTLRLEKGYCLAGNEFEGGRTPVEAGLDWLVDWDHSFLGKRALQEQKAKGHDELHGLVLERGIPRHGHPVLKDGAPVGVVTSGTQSPSLGKGIALAYLRGAKVGDAVQVDVRGKPFDAQVVQPPFL